MRVLDGIIKVRWCSAEELGAPVEPEDVAADLFVSVEDPDTGVEFDWWTPEDSIPEPPD